MDKCAFCGSKELEKLSEKQIVCKDCGFGFGNTGKETPENMQEHLKKMIQGLKLLTVLFPNDTVRQSVLRFQFHQHRVENHPTSDGYCEYCIRDWNKMSKKEMKERLGYNKDKWRDTK